MQSLPIKSSSQKDLDGKFSLPKSFQKDVFYNNSINFLLKVMPPTLKAAAGISMTSGLAGVLKIATMSAGTSGVAILGGMAAYSVVNLVSTESRKRVTNALSYDVQRGLTDYETDTADPTRVFTAKAVNEMFSRSGQEFVRQYKESVSSLVKLIPMVHEKLSGSYIKEEEQARALFVYQILSDLDNDKSPFAMRIKEESVFQREEVKALLKDSHRFANLMTEQAQSMKEFGRVMEQALGEDAKFIIKEYRDYNNGKKEFFAFDLNVLEASIQSRQTDNVFREFGSRFVDAISKASAGELKGEALDNALERLSEFTKSEFRNATHNKDSLGYLADKGESAVRLLAKLSEEGRLEKLGDVIAARLKMKGAVDFASLNEPENAHKKEALSDYFAKKFLKKDSNYDLERPLERVYVETFLKKIEEKVTQHVSVDLSPSKLDKMNNRQLVKKMEEYKLSDLEFLNADDATAAVMGRVKARLFYELNKDMVKREFPTESPESYGLG